MNDTENIFTEFDVSRETFQRFVEYVDALKKWNKKINLISASSEIEIWNRHIKDSAQLAQYIDVNDCVVDIGSGAGLPGFVLALMGIKNITLVEQDHKKSTFLLSISKLAPYNIQVINDKVENIDISCDVLTSRALASIEDILKLCEKICISKKILLLKGESILLELEEAKKSWNIEYKTYSSVTNSKGMILELISWTKR